jgi:hypothetical protein
MGRHSKLKARAKKRREFSSLKDLLGALQQRLETSAYTSIELTGFSFSLQSERFREAANRLLESELVGVVIPPPFSPSKYATMWVSRSPKDLAPVFAALEMSQDYGLFSPAKGLSVPLIVVTQQMQVFVPCIFRERACEDGSIYYSELDD